MTMSSSNIPCNSAESPLRFSLKVLDSLPSNSFLCLNVMVFFKGNPPMFLPETSLSVFNCLMNGQSEYRIHIFEWTIGSGYGRCGAGVGSCHSMQNVRGFGDESLI